MIKGGKMKLIEKIKEYINSKNEVISTSDNVSDLYLKIIQEFYEYRSLYLEEAQKLNGHTHFKTKEVQEKVISLINEDERVLFIRDDCGRHIGFDACKLKLEDVVIRVLENDKVSLIQDNAGYNLGMMSAIYGLDKSTLKALDNNKASLQQNNLGNNIGMYASSNCSEEVTLKALENNEASIQQEENGYNIGMICAQNGLKQATFKALDNTAARNQVDKFNLNIIDHMELNLNNKFTNDEIKLAINLCKEDVSFEVEN